MKKVNRLRKSQDLRVLFSRGRRIETPFFRVTVRRNTLSGGRFAFITPKSVDKRATVRNRLRRMASEWIRKSPEVAKTPKDFAILIKKESLSASKEEFYGELRKTMEKAIAV